MDSNNMFGYCEVCDTGLNPVYFTEEEKNKSGWPTGRKRRAVSHLVCEHCGKKVIVDDSFDGAWHT
jgi:hypothetical protein